MGPTVTASLFVGIPISAYAIKEWAEKNHTGRAWLWCTSESFADAMDIDEENKTEVDAKKLKKLKKTVQICRSGSDGDVTYYLALSTSMFLMHPYDRIVVSSVDYVRDEMLSDVKLTALNRIYKEITGEAAEHDPQVFLTIRG